MIKLSECTVNTIENWCREFDRTKKGNLSQDEAKIFISLIKNESELDRSGIPNNLAKLKKDFIYNVIKTRMPLYDYKLTEAVVILLALILSTPGEVAMTLTYLQYKCHKYNIWEVNMNFIGLKVFPSGFPTESEFQRIWDLQKCDGVSDNLIDHLEYMSSIRKTN